MEYWDKRYECTEGQRFDWLESYDTLQGVISRCVNGNKSSWILNIGCGNASIQDELYEDGYHNIMNNDISPVVIEQMNRIKQLKGYMMAFDVMDVTQMTYEDEKFDLVLDKSTIDAMLCSDSPIFKTAQMLEEVWRVLKKEGVYLMISYSEPKYRMEHLTRPHIRFSIQIETITK